ncbi:MAG: hypothetical protein ACK5IQ_09860, partial [Bacteroidales bacterium]
GNAYTSSTTDGRSLFFYGYNQYLIDSPSHNTKEVYTFTFTPAASEAGCVDTTKKAVVKIIIGAELTNL